MENFNGSGISTSNEVAEFAKVLNKLDEVGVNPQDNIVTALQRWKQPWYKRVWTWLKSKFIRPKVLTQGQVLKLAEEMYLRGYLTDRDVLHLEANLGHAERLDPALLFKLKSFAESGEWKFGHPVLPVRIQVDNVDGPVLKQGNMILGYLFGKYPAMRTVPLKGSKAALQQVIVGRGTSKLTAEEYKHLLHQVLQEEETVQ